MKLMTINTHSLIEPQYEAKLVQLAEFILREQPDIVAMQEVNQSVSAPVAEPQLAEGLCPIAGQTVPLRQDNHAAQVARLLRQGGLRPQWAWLPAKIGYDRYDEGLALFSLGRPITAADSFRISQCSDYRNWKTRRTLGIQVDGEWFYTVHMGWWADEEEPFAAQWQQLERRLLSKKAAGRVWLLGDFNSPAEVRGQGYDCMRGAGWQDSFLLAQKADSGVTVEGIIDGWRDFFTEPPEGMRIDQIWCSQAISVQDSRVVLNGHNGPVVSDHFGVMIHI
ncbi:MAG: endonuclease/exonuclease/phosphatase family protein [Faecalibacterium sp.]